MLPPLLWMHWDLGWVLPALCWVLHLHSWYHYHFVNDTMTFLPILPSTVLPHYHHRTIPFYRYCAGCRSFATGIILTCFSPFVLHSWGRLYWSLCFTFPLLSCLGACLFTYTAWEVPVRPVHFVTVGSLWVFLRLLLFYAFCGVFLFTLLAACRGGRFYHYLHHLLHACLPPPYLPLPGLKNLQEH